MWLLDIVPRAAMAGQSVLGFGTPATGSTCSRLQHTLTLTRLACSILVPVCVLGRNDLEMLMPVTCAVEAAPTGRAVVTRTQWCDHIRPRRTSGCVIACNAKPHTIFSGYLLSNGTNNICKASAPCGSPAPAFRPPLRPADRPDRR